VRRGRHEFVITKALEQRPPLAAVSVHEQTLVRQPAEEIGDCGGRVDGGGRAAPAFQPSEGITLGSVAEMDVIPSLGA
jgi:hypothetical protein